MDTVKTILTVFLLSVVLIVGYIVRRQTGKRCKSDAAEFISCIVTGVIILGILMALSWIGIRRLALSNL